MHKYLVLGFIGNYIINILSDQEQWNSPKGSTVIKNLNYRTNMNQKTWSQRPLKPKWVVTSGETWYRHPSNRTKGMGSVGRHQLEDSGGPLDVLCRKLLRVRGRRSKRPTPSSISSRSPTWSFSRGFTLCWIHSGLCDQTWLLPKPTLEETWRPQFGSTLTLISIRS